MNQRFPYHVQRKYYRCTYFVLSLAYFIKTYILNCTFQTMIYPGNFLKGKPTLERRDFKILLPPSFHLSIHLFLNSLHSDGLPLKFCSDVAKILYIL